MNDYLYKIKNAEYVSRILILAPLVVWTLIIKLFLFKYKTIQSIPKIIIIPILLLPYVTAIYNAYIITYDDDGPSYPPTYGFCLNTDVGVENKKKGILGFFDLDCKIFNTKIVKSNARVIINRFFYLNYVLLLLALIIAPISFKTTKLGLRIYTETENIFKKNKVLLKMLCLSALFSVLGYMSSIFSNYDIISIESFRFVTGFLNISISLLIIILITILKEVLPN